MAEATAVSIERPESDRRQPTPDATEVAGHEPIPRPEAMAFGTMCKIIANKWPEVYAFMAACSCGQCVACALRLVGQRAFGDRIHMTPVWPY